MTPEQQQIEIGWHLVSFGGVIQYDPFYWDGEGWCDSRLSDGDYIDVGFKSLGVMPSHEELTQLRAALAEIELLRAAQLPRTMDTAPKDGKMILLFGEVEGSQGANGGVWVKSCFRGDFDGDTRPYWHWGAPGYTGQVINPTRWMPLPAPPDTKEQA